MNTRDISLKVWLDQNEEEALSQIQHKWNEIPSLNIHDVQDLQEGKLVKFQGMVQDMFDPEYYNESYEVTNTLTNEKFIRNGKYQDVSECQENEYINFESENNVAKDRQTFVVITAPGLNDWVKEIEKDIYKTLHKQNASPTVTSTKRSLNLNDNEQMDTESNERNVNANAGNKKQCVVKQTASKPNEKLVVSPDHLLNMPLPDRSGKACHVKVYKNADKLKLNEMVECIGFLSLNTFGVDQVAEENETDIGEMFTAMELQTHNPPTSLIPKIHCVAFKPIIDSNPLYNLQETISLEKHQSIGKELEIVLTQLLFGDELAAKYLIFHLISKVYSRQDLLALGKFTLNLSNVPTPVLPDYGRFFYQVLEQLIPKSHYLPISLENMNDLTFVPKKDYNCNRMTSGVLQLSNHTHLVLDETKLKAGKLNAAAVRAVGAVADVIKTQSISYDFNYYQVDFQCDIPILILSEGKSLLPSDIHIPLKPEDGHITTFEDVYEALKVYLKPELLTAIRKFLSHRRHAAFEISDNINEVVQNEFVKMRATENATPDDLHYLLVLARFVCLAEGKNVLDETCWRQACLLEKRRKERIMK